MQSNSRLRSTTLPHLQTGFSIRAKRARTRPRSIWLHGKKASAFGRSARERHHGPRWKQKNAAHCCQQTARHTTSSYRASWITAPLCSLDAFHCVGFARQARHSLQLILILPQISWHLPFSPLEKQVVDFFPEHTRLGTKLLCEPICEHHNLRAQTMASI